MVVMAHSSVVGMYAFCKGCCGKFELGALNARQIPLPDDSPYDNGWICRCDKCGGEFTYRRIEFVD